MAGESGASPGADGERKTITALFADIKGSTELMAEFDPEQARSNAPHTPAEPVLDLK